MVCERETMGRIEIELVLILVRRSLVATMRRDCQKYDGL